jgi:hypothetical protein
MLKKLFFFTTNDPENEARALVRSLVSYLRVNSGGLQNAVNLSPTTLSMTFSMTTFSLMTLGVMTLSASTLSMIILSILAISMIVSTLHLSE